MPVRDYETMLAHAVIGEEVCRIVRESGLMVPRQKPGRKPEKESASQKLQKAASGGGPTKPVGKPAKPKAVAPVEAEEAEDPEDEDDD